MTLMDMKSFTDEAQGMYDIIFNNSHTPMLVIDSISGRIRNGNPAACKYYGYTLEELLKLKISDINTLSPGEIFEEMSMAKNENKIYFKFNHKLSSGELREVEVYSGPIKINGESLLLSIIHDVQYKKDMEHKIKIQESYFRSLYENSPEAIAVLDNEFRIVNINHSFEKIFQYSLSEVKQRNITNVICEENMYDESTYFKDSINRGEYIRKETQRRRKDGKLVDVSFLGYPIMFNGEQLGVYGIYSDLSKVNEERKAYEEELKVEKNKAEEASRFKTKFIANIAHEIRTPMNGIVGIIDLLDDTQLTSEQREYFHMLRYSAERLSTIVNDVMDIAKIEAGKLELRNVEFHIKKFMLDIEKYFEIQAKKKQLEIIFNIDPTIPEFLFGDTDKLNQILFNLLTNAIKFTEQGFIHLDVVKTKRTADKIDVRFSISDTGIGIPHEQIGHLFYDFVQLDSANTRKYGGAGLGLSITKRLVDLMEGHITVESEYGKGSTFSFEIRLKILKPQSKIIETNSNCNVALSFEIFEGLKVLLVEDEYINQRIFKNLLEKKNCIVTVADNGRKALQILSEQYFDIILMDISIPEINGLELTKIIRQKEEAQGTSIPIIAVTAAVMNEDIERYISTGIDDYIAKPLGKDKLYSVISNVLRKQHAVTTFDLKPLMDKLEGNHKLLNEIVNEVASTEYETEFIRKIEKYIIERNAEKLAKSIHKFKGSISHFQICSMNDMLVKMNESCKNYDFPSLDYLIIELKNEYYKLKDFLLTYAKT